MGDEDSVAAVATVRLRLLKNDITEPHARPAGPSGRTRAPFPAGPIPAAILDHLQDAYNEAVATTRAVAPGAAIPADLAGVYALMDSVTQDLDATKRQVAEELLYRQGLEHGIRTGNADVVRPTPCPTCGCWSLVWDRDRQLVVCFVDDCTTAGRPTTWTLRQLAARVVEKTPARAAT